MKSDILGTLYIYTEPFMGLIYWELPQGRLWARLHVISVCVLLQLLILDLHVLIRVVSQFEETVCCEPESAGVVKCVVVLIPVVIFQ